MRPFIPVPIQVIVLLLAGLPAQAHHEARCANGDCLLLAEREVEQRAMQRHYSIDGGKSQPRATLRWGAVVEQDGQVFVAWGHDFESAATTAARRQCESAGTGERPGCRTAHTFSACAASARARHEQFAIVRRAGTSAGADAEALAECRARSGDDCTLHWSYCSDGTGRRVELVHNWGAVARAVGGGGGAILVTGRKVREQALTEAKWHCEQANKRACDSLFHFSQCAALAESADGQVYGWARSPEKPVAEQVAMETCASSLGKGCAVQVSGCN